MNAWIVLLWVGCLCLAILLLSRVLVPAMQAAGWAGDAMILSGLFYGATVGVAIPKLFPLRFD